jgi:hypothetical protein
MVGVPSHAQAMSLPPRVTWLSGNLFAACAGGAGKSVVGMPQCSLLGSIIKPIAKLLVLAKSAQRLVMTHKVDVAMNGDIKGNLRNL